MRAPSDSGALWDQLAAVVGRLGVDADEVLITSWRGGKSKLRDELELIDKWALALRRNKPPTARQLARELNSACDYIRRARTAVEHVRKAHWPRSQLYERIELRLDAALTEAAGLLSLEQGVLKAARKASKGNAAGIEGLFRRHAFGIWRQLGGARLERTDAIDFLIACENLVLGPVRDRDAVRKWLARNWQADTTS